ncbi:transmembrane protein 180-like isoform X3 [Stigmatopora argus]
METKWKIQMFILHQFLIGLLQIPGGHVQLFVNFGVLLVHATQQLHLLGQILTRPKQETAVLGWWRKSAATPAPARGCGPEGFCPVWRPNGDLFPNMAYKQQQKNRWCTCFGTPSTILSLVTCKTTPRSYAPGDWLSGLHLMVALCAFDGLLTFVLLAQCALFAEISNHHQNRLRLIKYSQVASMIGSSSVLFCGMLSKNMEDFASFQAFNVMVAILSCVCMIYTGLHSQSQFDDKSSEGSVDSDDGDSKFSSPGVKTLMWQIFMNRDFRLFVLMNFFQVFMLAFFSNFTLIFAEHLIPPNVLSSLARSVMYGAGFICPQLLVLSCNRLLHSVGYYRIILYSFYLEVFMGIFILALGRHNYRILALFLTLSMVMVQASFSLFSLPLADIIDSDMQKYKRSTPISSMVFGTNALFTKPAQSLAPMLVINILNQFGYEELKDPGKHVNASALENLHSVMFYLVCVLPMCVAAIQVLAWRPFSIRNSHTVDSKYIDS